MNGQAAAAGQPMTGSTGKATSEPISGISALSIALSLPDLTSTFQPACSSAANSTAAATGQVRISIELMQAIRAAPGEAPAAGRHERPASARGVILSPA